MKSVYSLRRAEARAGFTLVELLVVIGIIAVLIGILLPTLTKAQDSAKSTQCKSNLRQFGIAFNAYLADNKGRGYPAFFRSLGGSLLTGINSYRWFGSYWTGSGASQKNRWDYSAGWLSPYLKSPKVFECPAWEGWFPEDTNFGPIAYGNNNSIGGLTPISKVRKPAETAAFADAAYLNTLSFSTAAANNLTRTLDISAPSNNAPQFHGRHLKMGNVVWLDGHVTGERPYIQTTGLGTYVAGVVGVAERLKQANLGHLTPVPQSVSNADFIDAAITPNRVKDAYLIPDKGDR